MLNKVIIFDGKDDHVIRADYFFQDKLIESLTDLEVTEISKYTTAYSNLIKHRNTEYTRSVELGSIIMEQMVNDLADIKSKYSKRKEQVI